MSPVNDRKGGASLTTREALASVLSDCPSPASVNHLVYVSTRMALAYLYQKARLGSLRPEHFGLTFEDMALDSTAELFQRDDSGRFIELRAYFNSAGRAASTDAEMEIALRRIVFSKVSEGLFRRFRENDPNLGKVIRNTKDAVIALPGVRLERQGRQLWIVIGDDDELTMETPVAPPEVIDAYVTSALGSAGQMQEAVIALVSFLEMHPYYRNGFPVSEFAKIVRSAYIRLGAALNDDDHPERHFTADEVARAIDAATEAVYTKTFSTYVTKKKVDAPTFQVYLRTVRDVLESLYVHDTSSSYSHFDVMATYKPALSEDEYRRTHRNRVEYMVKIARTHVSAFLLDPPVHAEHLSDPTSTTQHPTARSAAGATAESTTALPSTHSMAS